jgi:hypothetical protein
MHFDFGFRILDFGFKIRLQINFVSETQTAECRSSKPDAAGSIPVAHFLNLGFRIWDLGFLVNRHKSQTEMGA